MINKVDSQHKDLIKKILDTGTDKRDRTGVGTKSIFGHHLTYNLQEGFPLLTLRKIHIKSFIYEMLWFLGSYDQEKYEKFGNTNIRFLLDNGVTYWSDWPYKNYIKSRQYRPQLPELTLKEFESKIIVDDDFALEFGNIGPGYGKQWINYGSSKTTTIENNKQNIIFTKGINQIDYLINELKKNPDSRRLILMAWKVDELDEVLLPPCHYSFQLYSEKMNPQDRLYAYSQHNLKNNHPLTPITDNFPNRKLSMLLNIRSQDLYLGNPFNVAQYALLLHMISQIVNMIPYKLIVNLGDVHLYNNSIDAAKKLLERDSYPLPELKLNENIKNIYDFRFEDIKIENYKSHPNIHVDVAV